jgi:putative transposase
VFPFFVFPPEILRVSYTSNAIESLHIQIRKIIKTRDDFPNDDVATKLLWLTLRNVTSKSKRSARECKIATNQFAILYGERFTGLRSRKPPRTQNF